MLTLCVHHLITVKFRFDLVICGCWACVFTRPFHPTDTVDLRCDVQIRLNTLWCTSEYPAFLPRSSFHNAHYYTETLNLAFPQHLSLILLDQTIVKTNHTMPSRASHHNHHGSSSKKPTPNVPGMGNGVSAPTSKPSRRERFGQALGLTPSEAEKNRSDEARASSSRHGSNGRSRHSSRAHSSRYLEFVTEGPHKTSGLMSRRGSDDMAKVPDARKHTHKHTSHGHSSRRQEPPTVLTRLATSPS